MARLMRCALLLCALLAVQSHETRAIQGNDACKSWCQEDGEKTWQVKCGFKGCKDCDECAESESESESESSRQVIVDSVNQASIQGNDACKSWCQEDGEKTWQVKCGFKGCKDCDECAESESESESESSRQVIVDSVNQALHGLALPGCDSYEIRKLQKAGAHEEQLTCPHGFEPLNEGSIPNHFQVSGCGAEGFLAVTVAQVQCKCTSGCQCEHEGKANVGFVGKFWSKAAPDGMKATQEVYKAYAQERGKAAQRLDLPENCFQKKKRRNSLGESSAAGESTSWPPPLNADWEAPEQHVDALTSHAKEKLLMLLETELNKIEMPKQVLEPCYGGTAQLDYGGKATLGLLDYYDQYTVGSQKFHSRTKKRSENKLNCCSRACSEETGYPAMWDKSACTPPELVSRNAKTRRRTTIYTDRPSCPLPEEMPKDAHLLRLAPCFVENYPICILIKLTQLDANTTLNEQTPLVLGWSSIQGLDLPGMTTDLKQKKLQAVAKREIHKRSRRRAAKTARAAAEAAEGKVERLESFIGFVQKADMIVREVCFICILP